MLLFCEVFTPNRRTKRSSVNVRPAPRCQYLLCFLLISPRALCQHFLFAPPTSCFMQQSFTSWAVFPSDSVSSLRRGSVGPTSVLHIAKPDSRSAKADTMSIKSENGWETLQNFKGCSRPTYPLSCMWQPGGVAQPTTVAPLRLDVSGADGYFLYAPPIHLLPLTLLGAPEADLECFHQWDVPPSGFWLVLANGKLQEIGGSNQKGLGSSLLWFPSCLAAVGSACVVWGWPLLWLSLQALVNTHSARPASTLHTP